LEAESGIRVDLVTGVQTCALPICLRPTTLRAVHFVIDNMQAATLRQDWVRANTGVTLDFIDCADRRLTHCAAELVSAEAGLPGEIGRASCREEAQHSVGPSSRSHQ